MIRKNMLFVLLTATATLVVVVFLSGQTKVQPSSHITAIDTRTGIVSAKVNTTGEDFQFTVKRPALLATLKIGQGVYADFQAKQISLDGLHVGGTIVSVGARESRLAPGAPGQASATPAPQACCSITELNVQSATVTAHAGAVLFTFRVHNASLLQSLKVGQPVWANFTTKQVSLDGQNTCCEILPNEASRLMNPSVVTAGGIWVPLGRVTAVSGDQLSIRTVVRSVQRGPRAAPRVTYPEDGATVTLTVKLANQARPDGLPSRVITATPGSSRVEVAGQNGQIRAMPGVLLEPPLPPLIGQMVWVNRTSRQIQWLNFPFSMRQEDDLGDSEHFRTHITVSLPGSGSAQGSVKGETDVWTFKEFGGFTGALRVTFVDDGGNALYSITKGGNDDWHVCGHSDFICGASGITRDWEAAVLPDVLLQTTSVKIQHSASGDTAWSDVFNDLLRICDAGGGCSTSSCNQSVPSTPSPHSGDPCTN